MLMMNIVLLLVLCGVLVHADPPGCCASNFDYCGSNLPDECKVAHPDILPAGLYSCTTNKDPEMIIRCRLGCGQKEGSDAGDDQCFLTAPKKIKFDVSSFFSKSASTAEPSSTAKRTTTASDS
ncbi:hypothetical protein BV898_02064 [Hypsibius exemplaris]|uniref:Secreted protein n=1 Tax=Hypsibius exemplaris TaxID=2072580 RepID=A0A1W0X9X4_HYPEX|nr:hypothetical protein BV898_02064 [Hypsibius exemplaris]